MKIFLEDHLSEDDEEFLLDMLAEGLELEQKFKTLLKTRLWLLIRKLF